MIEILTAAAALVLAILAGIERVKRKRLERKIQDDMDRIESDPIGFFDNHFNRVQSKSDPTKTAETNDTAIDK